MGKASKRSWILKGEVMQAKGDLPYSYNLRRERNVLVNKFVHSQSSGYRKRTESKALHLLKLWKYMLRAGVSL